MSTTAEFSIVVGKADGGAYIPRDSEFADFTEACRRARRLAHESRGDDIAIRPVVFWGGRRVYEAWVERDGTVRGERIYG